MLNSLVVVAAVVVVVPPLFGTVPTAAAAEQASDGCTASCGNISITYPFGVEPGCYLDGFDLTCKNAGLHGPPKLFLGDGIVQVLGISIPNGTVRINSTLSFFRPGATVGGTDAYHHGWY